MSNGRPFTLIFLNAKEVLSSFSLSRFTNIKSKVFRIENKKKFNLLTDHYLSSFASSKS